MQSWNRLVFLLAAIILVAEAAPPKPNPATQFTLTGFGLSSNEETIGRLYYDHINQRLRGDPFDQDLNRLGSWIADWKNGNAYWIDASTGQCISEDMSGKTWTNAWSFLDNAVYWGTNNYIGNKDCNLWSSKRFGRPVSTCFDGDVPVFAAIYNGTEVLNLNYVSHFVPSVDPSVFTVPSSCNISTPHMPFRPSVYFKKYLAHKFPLFF